MRIDTVQKKKFGNHDMISNSPCSTMDSNRDFVCDCHLAWFQDFVTNNVSPAVDHSQISCAQPQVGLIANTGLDFDILPCIGEAKNR